jgi:hypothetical protein
MKVYKLTDAEGWTRRGEENAVNWIETKMFETAGGGKLCTNQYIHAYEHPLLAVLHDPIHGNYGATARLWECEADGEIKKDGQTKLGCTKLTVLREIEKPTITTEQRIKYAILCSLEVYSEEKYVTWANRWLSSEDRTRAAYASADADRAARAAASAASAAAAADASAAYAAASAASARAARAACAAAAADAAAYADRAELNLIEIAERAIA